MSLKKISPLLAKKILKNNYGLLLDIRDTESFNTDHDSRAIHINQDSLPALLANTNKNTTILVMCYHGNSSQFVAQFLSEEGFTDVYSIDGGYEMWKSEIAE
ncbi:MAG: thiosulfate sulfurtransferase GlpE [Prevotella sp.]|jgi:thiosulfate sulfurtransferase|nr:thiosulfate sulfurtransferase GlpE [Prevotella sp.]